MTKAEGSEKRKFPRFVLALPLELSLNESEQILTLTNNISFSGIFCQVDRYIAPNTKLQLKMNLPMLEDNRKTYRQVQCLAEVARIEAGVGDSGNFHAGISFSGLNEEDRKLLLKFIRRKNLKEAEELKKMYLELKDMAARLTEVEECHPTAEHFRKIIEKAINEMDQVAHLIDYEINELKSLQ